MEAVAVRVGGRMKRWSVRSHRNVLSCHLSRLETGASSHAARTLYLSTGYTVCLPFGDYSPDPLSVFMEKHLLPIS